MIDIGVTMFLHGDDYGRDPRAFIGWANDTKLVFFYAMLAAAGLSVILCFVIIFNISTPQTRKDSVVEQLSSQGTGLTIMVMIFGMTWGFAFPAYIRFPDKETPDFFPIFQGIIFSFLFCEEVSDFEMPKTFSILDTVYKLLLMAYLMSVEPESKLKKIIYQLKKMM